MEEFVLKAIESLNIPQIIAIGLIMWVFYNRLDRKIIALESKHDKRFEKIENRIDKIEYRLNGIENSLVEIKTILRLRECCMIQDERHIPKAE